jgi:hypothetical protein
LAANRPFSSADEKLEARVIMEAYFQRWESEVNFREEKTILDVDQAQVRAERSVQTARPHGGFLCDAAPRRRASLHRRTRCAAAASQMEPFFAECSRLYSAGGQSTARRGVEPRAGPRQFLRLCIQPAS